MKRQGDDLGPVHGKIEAHDLDQSQSRVTGVGKASIGHTLFKRGFNSPVHRDLGASEGVENLLR